MRYLNTQANRKVTIATVREISAAAVDGKAYVVYSIDTDRTFSTDTDRELLLVTCDLETMEQSAPILLSEQETADTNPQLITYDGTVLMYWNQDGKLNCGDVVGYLNSTYNHAEYIENQAAPGVNNMGEIANAASSYFVTVQPGGNLCIVWVDWEETEDGNVPAVFFREYDPAYGTYKDSEGVDHTYGMWGNITKIASVEKDQDISDVAYLGSGRKMLISYKVANKEEEGGIASYDSSLMLLKGGNREEIDFSLFPNEFPLAGEKTSLAVSVRNLASLPSSKLTVKADLIDKDGNITPVGTQVFEDHFESNEKVTALFEDLVYPEKPNNYVLRVTAWDDDLDDYPAVKYFRLPYSEKIGYSGADLIIRPDGSYEFCVDVSNDGNKAFDGHIAAGYTEMDGEGENARSVFRALSQVEELKLGIGETGICSRDFASADEALSALGENVVRVADVKEITPQRLNTLARKAGARVYAEPGNVTYVGNGVACVHRVAGPATVDFGREVIPVDPLTGKTSRPLRFWRPDMPRNGIATLCYLP